MRSFSQHTASLPGWLLAFGAASVALSRMSHLDLVWIEEAYGMAAAAEVLRGKALYSDIWFDKPPLYALFYTLCGGFPGWPLRLLDIVWVLGCAWSVFVLARKLWDARTGAMAAALTCFGLTFWIPSAVMAIAPDLLMIVPAVLAIWAAGSRRCLSAGALAGIAVLCNSKGLLLLPVVALWHWRGVLRVIAGFAVVQLAAISLLPATEYWTQVWWWGSKYSADTFIADPLKEFVNRTGGWAFFHGTAVVGTVVYLWRSRDWRIGLWIVVGLAGVIAGLRFFPRYYLLLLPPVAVAGARGLMILSLRWRTCLLLLLAIPVIRFGPRYVSVALNGSASWSDAAMMTDSLEAARMIGRRSVFVWGYRPDIYVFSQASAGTPFLDSQPLNGVLADRHLFTAKASLPDVGSSNRRRLIQFHPDYIVDGLGPLNPALAIAQYSDLTEWLSQYEEVGRTKMSVILRRRPDRLPAAEKR